MLLLQKHCSLQRGRPSDNDLSFAQDVGGTDAALI
jgi:hypothetical protein